jgi:hypothetical protein
VVAQGKVVANITSDVDPDRREGELCANAADSRCRPDTVITDEEKQHVDDKCD